MGIKVVNPPGLGYVTDETKDGYCCGSCHMRVKYLATVIS